MAVCLGQTRKGLAALWQDSRSDGLYDVSAWHNLRLIIVCAAKLRIIRLIRDKNLSQNVIIKWENVIISWGNSVVPFLPRGKTRFLRRFSVRRVDFAGKGWRRKNLDIIFAILRGKTDRGTGKK